MAMRKSFLHLALNMLKKGRINWALSCGFKYLNLKSGGLPTPLMGFIIPTYRCNSNCSMCNLISMAAERQKELDTSAIKNIIDEFHQLNTSGINFTGGEPLLRDDIFELLTYVKDNDFATSLCTNGILLNERAANKLLEINLDNLNISLDSANKEIYVKIRGVKPEIFDSVINSIRCLSSLKKTRHKKTAITIVTVLSKDNITEINNIIRLAVKLGADSIGFTPLHQLRQNAISCKSDISINPRALFLEAKRAHIQIDNTIRYLNMCNAAFSGRDFPLKCYSGPTSLIVDCYRNIYPCYPFLELGRRIPDTKAKTLKEIWNSLEYHKIRQEMKACRACFWDCHAEMSIFLNA